MGRTACIEPQCLYNGALYPFFKVGKYLEQSGLCVVEVILLYFTEDSGEYNKNYHDSLCYGPDMNPASPKYKPDALRFDPACSVTHSLLIADG